MGRVEHKMQTDKLYGQHKIQIEDESGWVYTNTTVEIINYVAQCIFCDSYANRRYDLLYLLVRGVV